MVREFVHATPVIAQTLVAFTLTAVLGYALNDSGIAIPALMLLVLECAAAYVVAARLDEPVCPARAAVEPERARADDDRVLGALSAERRLRAANQRREVDARRFELRGEPRVGLPVALGELVAH